MAKTSQINRNKKREKLVAQYAAKRAELKKIAEDMKVPAEDRFALLQRHVGHDPTCVVDRHERRHRQVRDAHCGQRDHDQQPTTSRVRLRLDIPGSSCAGRGRHAAD